MIVNLAFKIESDLKELIPSLNFIYHVRKYLFGEPVKIIAYSERSSNYMNFLLEKQKILDEYHSFEEEKIDHNYDVFVHLNSFPVILYYRDGVKNKSIKLDRLLSHWKMFFYENTIGKHLIEMLQSWNVLPQLYIYAINNRKNCLNIMDVYEILGVPGNYTMHIEIESTEVLERLGVISNKYITIHRPCISLNMMEGPMLWPMNHYSDLIRLLKTKYPDKKIVQIGFERGADIPGVDFDFSGIISDEETTILLKNSWIHIDSMNDFVQLRNVMHGGASVMLWGALPKEYYAYPTDINIDACVCLGWCSGLDKSWRSNCVRGMEIPECMEKITPEQIIGNIEEKGA